MKSFGIEAHARINDPRWQKFIDWCNKYHPYKWDGRSINCCYGFSNGEWVCSDRNSFNRILTLDEWEAEFMQPKLAGREYDRNLFEEWEKYWHKADCPTYDDFIKKRYAKTDRIAEIKAEMEKLSNELKELEG